MIPANTTGYSGLWDTYFTDGPYRTTQRRQNSAKFANVLFKGLGNKAFRKTLMTLIGVAPGATATDATAQRRYVSSLTSDNMYGGLVQIVSRSAINRATTAGDVTDLVNSLSERYVPTYPVDRSGNGGGGKLGF